MTTTTKERPAAMKEPREPAHRAPKRLTFAEYMEIERESETRHDLVKGIMIPVSGGTTTHNTICANVIRGLGNALEDTDCRAMTSDQKVYTGYRAGRYPDVVVACGDLQVAYGEALQNPVLIVEVLSDSTAFVDRGEKYREYCSIESLRHYVLIDQYHPGLEHYRRESDGDWKLTGDYVSLSDTWRFSLGGTDVAIPLAKIYRFVTFPEISPFAGKDVEETPK